ncbi:MAG: hypothetical protein KIT39_01530 [Nitrospirales bacterium]|nr:hypothetical protein [Nitrospirales bacterium]
MILHKRTLGLSARQRNRKIDQEQNLLYGNISPLFKGQPGYRVVLSHSRPLTLDSALFLT